MPLIINDDIIIFVLKIPKTVIMAEKQSSEKYRVRIGIDGRLKKI